MAEHVSVLERKVRNFMDGRVGKGFSAKETVELVQLHYTDPSSVCQILKDGSWGDLTEAECKFVADVMKAELELPGLQ